MVNTMRAAYAVEIAPLKKAEKAFVEKDRALWKQQEQMFPQSMEEFRKMKYWSRPFLQVRIARYLTEADPDNRERMRDRYKWAWRFTDPLDKEYKRNVRYEHSHDVFERC
jgi:hypothetical protein